ncbi:MAG: tetratricopeptide repeat protein [SAR324 cluster bacterium]
MPPLQAGAVLPFQSLRRPDDAWIGDYLADVLRRRVAATERMALVSRDAALQYAAHLAFEPLAAPTAEQWTKLGLDYLVVGTVQRVLNRVAVKVRMLARSGDLNQPVPLAWTVDLVADTPESAAAPLLDNAAAAFKLPSPTVKPVFPERWDAVQAVYGLAARMDRPSDGDARTALLADLQPFAAERGLAGRVAELEALLRLEQAILTLKGEQQAAELKRAQAAAKRALDEASADTDRRALLGEIDYFMKEDYLAKTEASVARLKNPLNGLAWAVLGLVAGPSSGEGTEQLKRARQADPFLWPAARAPNTPPFQGGILDGTLSRWAAQRDPGDRTKAVLPRGEPAESRALLEGIAAFEARRWDLADAAFREAADEDDSDYRPLLYRLRILIETGRSQEAVAPLRELQAENPLEVDVQAYLGVALERSDALDEARTLFQRILQDDPRQPVALYHLGLTAMAEKAWADALEPLRTLVGIQPRHEDAWLQLGIAQANLKRWALADEAFRQVLSLNPKSQPAREWRARIEPNLAR